MSDVKCIEHVGWNASSPFQRPDASNVSTPPETRNLALSAPPCAQGLFSSACCHAVWSEQACVDEGGLHSPRFRHELSINGEPSEPSCESFVGASIMRESAGKAPLTKAVVLWSKVSGARTWPGFPASERFDLECGCEGISFVHGGEPPRGAQGWHRRNGRDGCHCLEGSDGAGPDRMDRRV